MQNPDYLELTNADREPDWWPYRNEHPHWHVWEGVAGLKYARRMLSSPPRVVRAVSVEGLKRAIDKSEAERGVPVDRDSP